MTARDAIDRADALLPNPIDRAEKLRWLSELEGQLTGKPTEVGEDSGLTVEAPYGELYVHWLQAKCLYVLGEYTRYENARAQFNGLYLDWTASLIRAKKPETTAILRY